MKKLFFLMVALISTTFISYAKDIEEDSFYCEDEANLAAEVDFDLYNDWDSASDAYHEAYDDCMQELQDFLDDLP